MDKFKLNPFQIALFVIFAGLAALAMAFFANQKGASQSANGLVGSVTIWGTIRSPFVNEFFKELKKTNEKLTVTYIEKDSKTFRQDLLQAIATGKGPDIVFLPHDALIANADLLYAVPYESYPQRAYLDTYVGEAELYLTPSGILGFPLTVDPLMLYYNKALFEAEGIVDTPKTWVAFAELVPKLTKKDKAGNITQSAVALGLYNNVDNAKDIIATLLLQSGNPIMGLSGNSIVPFLRQNNLTPTVLNFYLQFANPLNELYTWNSAFENSQAAFISEKTAMYFGYASELPAIAMKNPNLNFDIIPMPQSVAAKKVLTLGNMYGLSLLRTSKSFNTAFAVANIMSGTQFVGGFVNAVNLSYPVAPARKDLLKTPPKNIYSPIVYNSGLVARGWLDPGRELSGPVFKDMINNILTGVASIDQAIGEANERLSTMIQWSYQPPEQKLE